MNEKALWLLEIVDIVAGMLETDKPPLSIGYTDLLTDISARTGKMVGSMAAGIQVGFNAAYLKGYRDAMAKASADVNKVDDKLEGLKA